MTGGWWILLTGTTTKMHQPQVMCDSNFYDIILLHKYEYLNYFDNLHKHQEQTNKQTQQQQCTGVTSNVKLKDNWLLMPSQPWQLYVREDPLQQMLAYFKTIGNIYAYMHNKTDNKSCKMVHYTKSWSKLNSVLVLVVNVADLNLFSFPIKITDFTMYIYS